MHALLGFIFEAVMEACTDTNKAGVGVLYDIGCTMEKGVIRVRICLRKHPCQLKNDYNKS